MTVAPIGRTIFGVTVWGPVPGTPYVLAWDGPGARLQIRENRAGTLGRVVQTLPGRRHTAAHAQTAADAIIVPRNARKAWRLDEAQLTELGRRAYVELHHEFRWGRNRAASLPG